MYANLFANFVLDLQSTLLILGIVMNTILGILILAKRRNEFVNKLYVFNIICIIWWSVTIVIYRLSESNLFYWTTMLYLAPTFIASSFLYFTFLFPEEHPRIPFRRAYIWIIAALNAIVVGLTLVPGFVLQSVQFVRDGENIITFGSLYFIYAAYISCFFGLGLLILARKLLLLDDPIKKRQLVYLLWGYLIASTLAMLTNLTLPYLGYFEYNWLGQVLTVFMVLPVTYAIFKHRLFDVTVIAAELITITLWLFFLVRLLLDTTSRERLIDGILLFVMILAGLLLIRSVSREVEQRQFIERQEKELEVANQQQESLLHFISHEIKGYLAKNEAAFAAITDGDFGKVEPQLHSMANLALVDTRKGVRTVMDILDASNMKKGTVSYDKTIFDIALALEETVAALQNAAKERGITLHFARPTDPVEVFGDQSKIREHVLRNVVDNSIKYTEKGNVTVSLAKAEGKVRINVVDTGVGITPEDMTRLFTAGGHGKESIHINVHSTGYGLFIAKSVVEAHGGKIWAESEGAGRGSRFIIELPLR